MPLDPDIQAMADEVRALKLPPIDEVTVAQARAGYSLRYRERSLPPPADVTTEYLKIPVSGAEIEARLYRPSAAGDERLPLVVYFHGGGFVLGDAEAYELQSMGLAARAHCAVLFVDFRLAPEHSFPTAVDDAIASVRWAATNHERFKTDPARLAIMGDSAGGNLTINACLHARDHGGVRIALQVLLYPLTDFRPFAVAEYRSAASYPSVDSYSEGYLLDRQVMEWFARHYLAQREDAVDWRASPLLAGDLAGLPPAVVITAECDPLRDMGAAFAQRLETSGVPVAYHCMAGLAHNFMGHVARSAAAERAFTQVADILRARLAGSDGP